MVAILALKEVDLSTKEGREYEIDLLRDELNAAALADQSDKPCPHGGTCECPREKERLKFTDRDCNTLGKCPPRAKLCPNGTFAEKP